MTETEWLTAAHPWDMISFAHRQGVSNRKLRLFACACVRQVCNDFLPPLVPRAVAAAEAFADREISAESLARVRGIVAEAIDPVNRADAAAGTGYLSRVFGGCLSVCWSGDAWELAQDAAQACAFAAADVPLEGPRGVRPRTPLGPQERPPEVAAERALQAELLRDIVGNPFRSSGLELEWLTDTVRTLAKQMYDARDFGAMPILADALQDAGCDDEGILSHCRADREHVKGCWVVDLLLGKS